MRPASSDPAARELLARITLACARCSRPLPPGAAVCETCRAPHHETCAGPSGCARPRLRRALPFVGRLVGLGVALAAAALALRASALERDLAAERALADDHARLFAEQRRRAAAELAFLRLVDDGGDGGGDDGGDGAEAGVDASRADSAWLELVARGGERPRDPPGPAAAISREEAELEAGLAELERLARARDVEGLVAAGARLRERLAGAQGALPSARRARLERALADLPRGCRSDQPLLQGHVTRGNAGLRALAAAIERDDWETVEVVRHALADLCATMREQEREVFHRSATALEERADAVVERARRGRAWTRPVLPALVPSPPRATASRADELALLVVAVDALRRAGARGDVATAGVVRDAIAAIARTRLRDPGFAADVADLGPRARVVAARARALAVPDDAAPTRPLAGGPDAEPRDLERRARAPSASCGGGPPADDLARPRAAALLGLTATAPPAAPR